MSMDSKERDEWVTAYWKLNDERIKIQQERDKAIDVIKELVIIINEKVHKLLVELREIE